jgi:hypothetical protein
MNLNPFTVDLSKLTEKLMNKVPDLPDMSGALGGYEFKDGMLKAGVDYWTSDGKEIDAKFGFVRLYAAEHVNVNNLCPQRVDTTLTLDIKPPSIAFKFELVSREMRACLLPHIRMANDKDRISFQVMCYQEEGMHINKGDLIGLGYFIPVIPLNNILLNKQNAPT